MDTTIAMGEGTTMEEAVWRLAEGLGSVYIPLQSVYLLCWLGARRGHFTIPGLVAITSPPCFAILAL